MRIKWIAAVLVQFLLLISIRSQPAIPEVRLSELFEKGTLPLVQPEYMKDSTQSFYDTVRLQLLITNDLGTDTTILYAEGLNEWVEFIAKPLNDSLPGIKKISGRDFYWIIPYDYLYYPTQYFRLKAGVSYHCEIRYKGIGYHPATKAFRLLSPKQYGENSIIVRRMFYSNHIITYLFVGAISFGFLFFLFLYIKSKYLVFGIYAVFLMLQALYGAYQIDLYTKWGQLFFQKAFWDDFIGEFLVFIAQALYMQFMIQWMNIKSTNKAAYRVFNGISIFFLAYALTFTLFYFADSDNRIIGYMQRGMRMAIFAVQLIVFYYLIFKIKTPVKSYIITGSSLLVFFAVIMVFMHNGGLFKGIYLNEIDNGSWYMIGILAECICFSMGLGLRYFQIDQENIKLHKENIRVLQDKLNTERAVYDHEIKLAEVNQELTNQQLTALRAQMNPHFIFNALNSIQKYIVKGDVDEANSYLSKFSKLQRMILSYCEENFITLDKEIDMLRLYLELEQLRLTHEFTFSISIDDEIEAEEIPIPPMMMQPFAENAIWHGLLSKEGEKNLRIHFGFAGDDVLQCVIDDNGIGRKAAQKLKNEKLQDKTINRSKGMSLVYGRLEILEKKYGRKFSVKITDKVDENQLSLGTTVELSIPVVD